MSYELGDIVSALIMNGVEDSQSTGKLRPAVVVHRPDRHYLGVAGLTTSSAYRDGTPRIGFSGRAAGLNQDGYLWGGKLVRIHATIHVRHAIGRCYPQMARDIVTVTDPGTLNHDDAQAFLEACGGIPPRPGPGIVDCPLCEVTYRREGDEEHIACRTVLGIR